MSERTALLHYWLINRRGGENVLAEFCRLWPEADIFTHAWNRELLREPFSSHRIYETFIGQLPGARRNCQKFLPLMPTAIRRLDLSGYKLIISSESGPIKGVRKPKGSLHICYCHTPMRYVWDMFEDYYRSSSLTRKAAMLLFRNFLRRYDLSSADSVDAFIANSHFVAERIRRIYGRESTVIYPPVEYEYFRSEAGTPKEEFYLCVGEFNSYKRPDLAIAACRKLGRRLILVGDGELRPKLEAQAGPNIKFVGRPSRSELRTLYAKARGLIFPGVEDFGIVPLEAQAAGTAIIALGQGGALETVLPDKTGIFFAKPEIDLLCEAIERFEAQNFDSAELLANAERFTIERFHREIRAFVDSFGSF